MKKISSKFNKRIPTERILECSDVLEAINEVLTKDLNASLTNMRGLDNYDTHNWKYLMADYLATQRTLNNVITLLTIRGDSDV